MKIEIINNKILFKEVANEEEYYIKESGNVLKKGIIKENIYYHSKFMFLKNFNVIENFVDKSTIFNKNKQKYISEFIERSSEIINEI